MGNNRRFTEKELLALKAVKYGCLSNKKLFNGDRPTYVLFDKDMNGVAEMLFAEAVEIIHELINREECNE